MTTPARLKMTLVAVLACAPLLFTDAAHASSHHAHWHRHHHVAVQAMASVPADPPAVHMRYFGGPKGGMWPEAR